MRKSKKYKVYNGRILKEAIENSRIYILIILFIIGIIIGANSIRNTDSSLINQLRNIVDAYKNMRQVQEFSLNFIYSFVINSAFCACSCFLGFSLIGFPFIMWLPIIRGMSVGAVCGYLYSTHKLSGIGFALLTIYPGLIISTMALIISCNNSCEYSKNAYLKAVHGRGQFERGETRLFLVRQVFCILACLVAALIDSGAAKLLSGLFLF